MTDGRHAVRPVSPAINYVIICRRRRVCVCVHNNRIRCRKISCFIIILCVRLMTDDEQEQR